MVDGREILQLVARYDRATDGLERDAIARIHNAFDAAFRALEREMRTAYPELQSVGSLIAAQRKLLVLDRLGGLLDIYDPAQEDEYQRLMEEVLQLSSTTGGQLAGQLIQAYESTELQAFAGIPIEAIANQATEGVRRLRRYSDEFKDRANIIIGQGLIQGWGAARVATALRSELGVAKGKAETLARTEILSSLNQAAIARYQQNGIEYVQWAASPSEVCPFCVSRNQQVFRAEEIVFPPHPRCRCFLLPYKFEWQQRGLTDDEFAERYRQEGIAELAAQGHRPNSGLSPFEKAARLEQSPEPVWTPGDAPLRSRQEPERKRKKSPAEGAATQEIVSLPTAKDLKNEEKYRLLGSGQFGSVYLSLEDKTVVKKGKLRRRVADFDDVVDDIEGTRLANSVGVGPKILASEINSRGSGTIKMERVSGKSLESLQPGKKALPKRDRAIIGARVADQMKKLHEGRIMHRDLHSGNIMYNRKNNRVSIIDFGFTQKIEGDKVDFGFGEYEWLDAMYPKNLGMDHTKYNRLALTKRIKTAENPYQEMLQVDTELAREFRKVFARENK